MTTDNARKEKPKIYAIRKIWDLHETLYSTSPTIFSKSRQIALLFSYHRPTIQ